MGVTALPRQTQLVYHAPKEKELFSDFCPQNVELFARKCALEVFGSIRAAGESFGSGWAELMKGFSCLHWSLTPADENKGHLYSKLTALFCSNNGSA